MPSSGARAGTRPSRSARGAGDGRVGATLLTCGHPLHGQPAYRRSYTDAPRWWCDTCHTFKRRAS